MTITQVKQALGSWEIRLRASTPREVLDALSPFGHLAVLPGRLDPAQYGDNLLRAARYVGVYRGRANADEFTLRGAGMALWLGDEDDKGYVYEAPVQITGLSFPDTVRALLPAGCPIVEGTLYPGVPGTYTGTSVWTTPRKALTFVADTMGSAGNPVEWRVNGDGTLDAGPVASLYRTQPVAVVVRKGAGRDLSLVALPGKAELSTDVEDYTTRVVLLAQGTGDAVATGSADAAVVPYRDLRGNPVKLTRMVSESATDSGLASARAQLQLNRFTSPRQAVALSSSAYDITGDVVVGDYVHVFDPDNGFTDPGNEVVWRGERINPVALRVAEMTWPVPAGWTVAFRDGDGTWWDLSDHYAPEGGETRLVVGDFSRSLTTAGSEPVGGRVVPDASVPAAPAFGTFASGAYQAAGARGETRAQIQVTWAQPLNTDGSTVLDGDHYEIRYRANADLPYPATWAQVEQRTWAELYTWAQPIVPPITDTDWHYADAAWDASTFLVQELTPGVDYEFQIRAVDAATPPNMSAWSAVKVERAAEDTIPPATPAPPEVAGSRIAIQVVHRLGRADGGTFNLDLDLDHLEVHVAGTPTFEPDASTVVGKLPANAGMITGGVPVVATLPVEELSARYVKVIAVDRAGNASGASAPAAATALLIDDAHISDLTVSKVTAGSITSDWLIGARIKTADSGARVELNADGVQAYDASNNQTVDIASTGNVTVVGTIKTDFADQGVEIRPGTPAFIRLRSSSTTAHYARLYAANNGTDTQGDFSVRRVADDVIDGGKVLLWNNSAVVSHQPASGAESFIWFGYGGAGQIGTRGQWINTGDAQSALVPIADTVGAGYSGSGYTYGPTLASIGHPLIMLQGTSGSYYRWQLSANSTTGWSVEWDDATGKTVHSMAWR